MSEENLPLVTKFSWFFTTKVGKTPGDRLWWVKQDQERKCTFIASLHVYDIAKYNARVLTLVLGPISTTICMWPLKKDNMA